MTKREKEIIEISSEINRLLSDGINIHSNSPIHMKLNDALKKPEVIKNKKVKKVIDTKWFENACDIIERI
jgi:hypothetical protein